MELNSGQKDTPEQLKKRIRESRQVAMQLVTEVRKIVSGIKEAPTLESLTRVAKIGKLCGLLLAELTLDPTDPMPEWLSPELQKKWRANCDAYILRSRKENEDN